MISEGSYIGHWSNDVENSALHQENKYIWKSIQIQDNYFLITIIFGNIHVFAAFWIK